MNGSNTNSFNCLSDTATFWGLLKPHAEPVRALGTLGRIFSIFCWTRRYNIDPEGVIGSLHHLEPHSEGAEMRGCIKRWQVIRLQNVSAVVLEALAWCSARCPAPRAPTARGHAAWGERPKTVVLQERTGPKEAARGTYIFQLDLF